MVEEYLNSETLSQKFVEFLMCLQTVWFFTFGELDDKMKAFLILILLDFATGIRKSIFLKQLSSAYGAKGIEKKVRTLVVIAVARLIDKIVGLENSTFLSVSNTVMAIYACNEGLSILENLSTMGTWIPDFVKEKLIQVKQQTNSSCKNCNKGGGNFIKPVENTKTKKEEKK